MHNSFVSQKKLCSHLKNIVQMLLF